MAPRLPRLTAAELLRALRRDGWYVSKQEGSHVTLRHPSKGGYVLVPVHARKTIGAGLLDTILERAGLTSDDLRRLL